MADDSLLTVQEAAKYLRVSTATVRKWTRAGRLDALRTPGGHRRFRPADLDACLSEENGPEAA